jgi:hypothetical protein
MSQNPTVISPSELARQERVQATQQHGWHQPTTDEIASDATATRDQRAGVPPTLAETQANAASVHGHAERKP